MKSKTKRIVAGSFVCKFECDLDLRLVKLPFLSVARLPSDPPSLISAHFFDIHWSNKINGYFAKSTRIYNLSHFLGFFSSICEELRYDDALNCGNSHIMRFIIERKLCVILRILCLVFVNISYSSVF